MSVGIIKKGTLLMPSGNADHLFIICSDPIFYLKLGKDCFLSVNITSIKPDIEHDNSCILNAGDHPFVHHPSYVLYRKADIFGVLTISQSIAEGDISIHHPCDDALFTRVMAGFAISNALKPSILNFYSFL